MIDIDNIKPVFAEILGAKVYGLFRYSSIFNTRANNDTELSEESEIVYNFKKHRRNRLAIEYGIREMADFLKCSVIVAIPGHTTETNMLQEIFGAKIRRITEVNSRKYDHKSEIDAAEEQTLECDEMPNGRVMLIDDVCTTGKSLIFFRNYLANMGVDAEMCAVGIAKQLKPQELEGYVATKKSARVGDDKLQVIEDCGAAEMPLDDTYIIAQITESQFLDSKEMQTRYHTGQLKTKLAIRQAVIKMAKAGVPQMVKVYQDFTAENTQLAPSIDLSEISEEFSQI